MIQQSNMLAISNKKNYNVWVGLDGICSECGKQLNGKVHMHLTTEETDLIQQFLLSNYSIVNHDSRFKWNEDLRTKWK